MKSSIARELMGAGVKNLKSALRASLLSARTSAINAVHDCALAARVKALFDERKPQCVGFYWPMTGEFDARPLLTQWLSESANRIAALPVVTDLNGALSFCRWTPETAMTKGRFQIPVPTDAIEVRPDLLLIPCLGFDQAGYRLGYGGGFYDRTLASASSPLWAVGIAYECGRVDALPREPHDLPLDSIMTEAARYEGGREQR